jgi:hypothetical protein
VIDNAQDRFYLRSAVRLQNNKIFSVRPPARDSSRNAGGMAPIWGCRPRTHNNNAFLLGIGETLK